ncbi:MAG: leucyl aminopeptidase, partial [Phototrophicales bacterium]
ANLKLKNIAILLYEDETLSPSLMAEAKAESTLLTLYQYHGQKSSAFTPHTLEHVVLIGTDENNDLATIERSIAQATVVAESTALTRNLVNLPPNYCTPEYMATTAVEMANEVGLQVKVLDKEDLQALNMGAFLAVAQGSLTPPKFIILEHNAERSEELPTVVLVGKGVTFDTGGYTIKSRDGMKGMKNDMSGGAAVIGALRAAALLEIPLHVVGLIPAADNMISGNAYRPDDVFTASNGKTVEIVSTDAEGRLLLADALVYASRYKPDAIVDIATLTGACVTALGGVMAGLFCTDTQLQQRLLEAGKLVNEPLWPLPLDEAYKKSLKSHTADTKNSGAPRGGASIAAMFLSNFVDCACWAHIDMAGIEMRNDSIAYIPSESASGYGTRLLIEFLRHWADL